MSRIFTIPIIFLSVVIFFFGFNRITYAIDPRDPNLEIIPPSPAVTDSQVTITVQTKDGSSSFNEKKYSFAAWKGDLSLVNFGIYKRLVDYNCVYINFNENISNRKNADLRITLDKSKAIAIWPVDNKCVKMGDVWHFRLWASPSIDPMGSDWDTMIENNFLVEDYKFQFVQPNGKIAAIKAGGNTQDSNVYSGENATVVLSNAADGASYTFWWHGAYGIAEIYHSKGSGNFEIEIKNRMNGKQRLCMEFGDAGLQPPKGHPCNQPGKFVDFEFHGIKRPPTATLPPGIQTKCFLYAAHLPTLKERDSLAVGYMNLPPRQEFKATLVNKDGTEVNSAKAVSDQKGSLLISVITEIGIGEDYKVTITDSSNKEVCSEIFSATTDGTSPKFAKCDDSSCTRLPDNMECKDGSGIGINTAIGCIHTNPAALVKDLLRFILGIGGGIAFLMMLLGVFQMLTSAGNPETLNAGKERLTSAVIGLLFVIFSILLLQIIGWGILKIPGLGS